MADTTIINRMRVVPSLLDRLSAPRTEDYISGARAQSFDPQSGVTVMEMRASRFGETVIRDLEWLFNASPPLGLMAPEELKRYPHAASSVLNYGLRGLFGKPVHDLDAIETQVADAIAMFEPRLRVDFQRLEVSRDGQIVHIVIEGTMLINRAARRIVVRTDLDTLSSKLETDG